MLSYYHINFDVKIVHFHHYKEFKMAYEIFIWVVWVFLTFVFFSIVLSKGFESNEEIGSLVTLMVIIFCGAWGFASHYAEGDAQEFDDLYKNVVYTVKSSVLIKDEYYNVIEEPDGTILLFVNKDKSYKHFIIKPKGSSFYPLRMFPYDGSDYAQPVSVYSGPSTSEVQKKITDPDR